MTDADLAARIDDLSARIDTLTAMVTEMRDGVATLIPPIMSAVDGLQSNPMIRMMLGGK